MANRTLGYGPQGLALEVNPWLTREAVDAAHRHRGAIVGGWANVETSLIELSIRTSRSTHYSDVRDAYPSKLKARLTYLRKIFELPGPLSPYSSLGTSVINRFEDDQDMRNMMAHGRMTVMPDWGATFHFFEAKSGAEISYRTARFTETQLRFWATRATRFSRAVRAMAQKLDEAGLLPPLIPAEE